MTDKTPAMNNSINPEALEMMESKIKGDGASILINVTLEDDSLNELPKGFTANASLGIQFGPVVENDKLNAFTFEVHSIFKELMPDIVKAALNRLEKNHGLEHGEVCEYCRKNSEQPEDEREQSADDSEQ